MKKLGNARGEQRSISTIRQAIASGNASASELFAERVALIEEINPTLNAFVRVLPFDGGRRSAGRPASSASRSLDGATIAIKDNIDVGGIPTTAGMIEHERRVATDDAACVWRLKKAGASIIGKTNLPEGGLGSRTSNPLFGRTANPHDIERTAGGSSGGSAAAVAAGLCDGALGTDTLGSVRIPASYCGVVGFKPTYGSVSSRGILPLAWSFDTVGVLARTVENARTIFEALRGYDPRCTSSVLPPRNWASRIARPSRSLRIGVIAEIEEADLDIDIRSAFETMKTSLGTQGHSLDELRLDVDLKTVRRAGLLYSEVQGASVHASIDTTLLSPDVRSFIEYGRKAQALDLAKADLRIREAKARLLRIMREYDFVLTPTTPQTAFDDSARPPASVGDFTALASIAHLPALSLPVGIDRHGLPIGIQVVGGPWSDFSVLSFAQYLENQLQRHLGAKAQRNGKSGRRPSALAAIASSKSSP